MTIQLNCPCGKWLKVRDDLAGKRVKCPGCQAILGVPEAAPPPPKRPAERVLTFQKQEWEEEWSFKRVLAGLLHSPAAALAALAATEGRKRAWMIGIAILFAVSLLAAAGQGYVGPNPFALPEPKGPVETPEQRAQRKAEELARKLEEQKRAAEEAELAKKRLENDRRLWLKEVERRGTFPELRGARVEKPYKVYLSADPKQILEGTSFTLTFRAEPTQADAGVENLPLMILHGPYTYDGRQVKGWSEVQKPMEKTAEHTYTVTASRDIAGAYQLDIVALSNDWARGVGLEYEMQVGTREPPPMPDHLKEPVVVAPPPPLIEIPGAGKVEAVITTMTGENGPLILAGAAIVAAVVDLLVMAGCVLLAGRVWGFGAPPLLTVGALALVSALLNVAGFGVEFLVKAGPLRPWRGVLLMLLIVYSLVLYTLVVVKVCQADGIQGIVTVAVAWLIMYFGVAALMMMLLATLF